ncbi:non-hydrolyzing UDP-N-acetylglucosamine 2-epimerase [Streptomyces beijiangensis]|uniref:UDP-N-acetylglucosamine 2-epimerase (Non-hydrolyzing) n=1 Tax=Streptomyces beijiangensis TaxID=163361 RepID=A0A939F8R5_9ACTN|nr:UDP-N-acetylglucosamine 2-epimerase (non-hydrolyzing) [Streptomyces beijiangensis]MBO0514465.1 UDP-N-acetylglucosamine 2-epimerase (non-hydrolyzing) [Streptomyces beijiangensis]
MNLSESSVAVVLGTRPELVKLAPLLHELGPAARLVHTGQHWDEALSGRFIDELDLPAPELLHGIGGHPRGTQIGRAVEQLDELFAADRPAAVVVQGDTNATLAGALAANARSIPLVHVEAGLRSHDRAMPEEHNRVMVDQLADLLCAATTENRTNLLAEGHRDERIALTGNTVVEVVRRSLPDEDSRAAVLAGYGLRPDTYVLATVHRPENTDDADTLRELLSSLRSIEASGTPVLLPLHPRTRSAVERFGLGPMLTRLLVVPPVGYGEFLALARHAALLVSDSGGVQEECTVLGRPLLVVRRSTERPESVDAGFAALVRPGEQLTSAALTVLAGLPERLERLARTPSPYGDGLASARIVRLLEGLAERPATSDLQRAA